MLRAFYHYPQARTKTEEILWASIVLALIGLTFNATLGGSIYRETMEKYRVVQQASQSENKADSDNPQDYEDVSAAYIWTEEDFENLKPKKDTLRSIIKRHGKAKYVKLESSGLKVEYSRGG